MERQTDTEMGSSRADAMARGLKLYFTGKPCTRGYVAPRNVCGVCQCDACKSARNDMVRKWQAANPERRREIDAQSKLRNKGKDAVRQHEYRAQHSKRITERVREWQRDNPERVAVNRKRWLDANPEIARRAWKRRAEAEERAKPAWYTKQWDSFVLNEARQLAELRTKLTGIPWERDHLIPLRGRKASGLHCAENIQVIPRELNIWKGNRLVLAERGEWIKHT